MAPRAARRRRTASVTAATTTTAMTAPITHGQGWSPNHAVSTANRLVVFDVSDVSLHQVREVLAGLRISLAGWFYP